MYVDLRFEPKGETMAEGSEVLFFSSDSNLFINIYNYASRTSTLCWVMLITWLIAEVAFAVFIFGVVNPRIQQLRPPNHQPYRRGSPLELVMQIVKLIKSLTQSYSFRRFCEGWFLGARIDDIKAGNVVSFLSWALFCDTPNGLSKENLDVVMTSVDIVQKELNHRFEEGYNAEVTHCRFTHEQIPFIHRPLAFHAIAAAAEGAANFPFLRLRGFSRRRVNGINYWIKTRSSSTKAPILLLHGICSGWFFYSSLISMLTCDRTVVMIETDSIKIKSLVLDMPSPEEFVTNVKSVMQIHNIKQFSVIGHSFGSIMAAWLVKLSPQIISHLTLLDPVSLLLALPDVAYNFIYRSPTTIMEHAIFFMASRELTISKMLHRDFYWYNNMLYLDDVPAHIGVIIGIAGKDEVLNPSALREYVINASKASSSSHNRLHHLYWEDYSHGQCLISTSALKEISGLLDRNEAALLKV